MKIKTKIINYLKKLDMPSFMFNELISNLDNMNEYRLKNIFDNIDELVLSLETLVKNHDEESLKILK